MKEHLIFLEMCILLRALSKSFGCLFEEDNGTKETNRCEKTILIPIEMLTADIKLLRYQSYSISMYA